MEQTDLQGMLGALTQNPDLMEKLRKIATGLATANTPQVSSPQPAPPVTATEIAPLHLFGDFSARKQLLCALRPYLHEKRRKKRQD